MAYGQVGDWHGAASVVWFNDDGDRNLNDEISGIQINVGREWLRNFAFEGVLGYSDIQGFKGPGLEVADEKHLDLSFNLLAFYDRDAAFAPYGLLGIGYLETGYNGGTPPVLDQKPGPDGGGASLTAGLGFKWDIGVSPFSMRGEYRLRFATEPTSLTDSLVSVGLQYDFGSRSDAQRDTASSWPAGFSLAGDWYAAGSIVWTNDDGDRNINDSVAGIQFNVGRDWTEYLSFEGVLGYSDIEGWKQPGLEVADERHLDLAVNLLAFYDRDAAFAPYALLGIGYLDIAYDGGTPPILDQKPGPDDGGASFTAGLGFKWRFGDSPFSLRGEYRQRFATEPTSLTDQLFTLGVQYNFGIKPRDRAVPPSDKPQDTDGDGVLDWWDDCPDTPPGVDVTARGCEIKDMTRDTDKDRVPDYRDECPDTPIGAPVGPTGCSLDSDMDGVQTGQDRCPATRAGAPVDEFGCEIEVLATDFDGDGVLNEDDRCADTRAGARVDIYGCEIRDIITLPGVNFASASDRLLPGAENRLRDAAQTLNRHPDLKVEVAGHTDNIGNPQLNLGLSDRRAKTVLDQLVEYGVDPSRLSFKGYGSLAPIADNATAEGRARNRRVELRIIE